VKVRLHCTPPPLPALWCMKHVATRERSAHFCRWQQRPGLCLKNPFVEERILCAPPPLTAPWCTKHVATGERHAPFSRWQHRPGLRFENPFVEERSNFPFNSPTVGPRYCRAMHRWQPCVIFEANLQSLFHWSASTSRREVTHINLPPCIPTLLCLRKPIAPPTWYQ
jgi:hypothetical protein